MSDVKQHKIDELFEESLSHLKVQPSDKAWDHISSELDAMKHLWSKNRWRWIGFSAAILAVALYIFSIRSCSLEGSPLKLTNISRIHFNNILLVKNIKRNIGDKTPKNTFTSLGHEIAIRQTRATKKLHSTDNSTASSSAILVTQSKSEPIPTPDIAKTTPSSAAISKPVIQQSANQDITAGEHNKPIALSNTTSQKQTSDSSNQVASSSISAPAPAPEIVTGLNIEAFAGPLLTKNNLPQQINFDDASIAQYNEEDFNTLEFGLQLKYTVSRFFIKTGFSFSQWGENTSFELTETRHDTSGGYASWNINRYVTYDTLGYYDDPNNPGVVYPILSATIHIDTLSAQWNSKDRIYYEKIMQSAHNRYRYIEMPFIVGIQQNIKKLRVYFAGGFSLGYMAGAKGSFVYHNKLTPYSHDINPYKSFNINYIGQAGFSYPLTNKWGIFAAAQYKSNVTSIYKPEFDPGAKYRSIGLLAGLSYALK